MACEDRRERLVALLYGELDPEGEDEMRQHLTGCASCSTALEELTRTRRVLDEARPEIPVGSPRVVMLAPAPLRRPLLAFAAGFACAVLLLAAGVALGARYGGAETASQARPVTEQELEALLATYGSRIERLDEENDRIRQVVDEQASRPVVYRDDLEQELTSLGRVLDLRRATDLDLVLGEIRAAEFRTYDRIGQTREDVRYALLANDPRLSVE